jgi:hypothetical protein
MIDFNKYLMRHGEFWLQDIIERIERNEGIVPSPTALLEQRWNVVMRAPQAQHRLAA